MAFDIRGQVPQLTLRVVDGEGPSGIFDTRVPSQGECSRHTTLSKLRSFDRCKNCANPTLLPNAS
jgi:hypothetical protein